MRLVCAYCRDIIHEPAEGCGGPASHGMCVACSEHFSRLWDGMSLCDYLDTLPGPVLVVDGAGRVIGANRKIATLFGRETAELRGLPPGEAFACVWSRLPEGCGGTVHCRDCTIRMAVKQVRDTGEALRGLRAWIQSGEGLLHLRISAEPDGALVKVIVERARTASAPALA